MPLCRQEVDPPSNSVQSGVAHLIADAQGPVLPFLHRIYKNLGDKVGKIVGTVLQVYASLVTQSEQI